MNRIQATKRDLLLGIDVLPLRFRVRKEHGKRVRKLRKLPKFDKEVGA